MRGAPRRAWLCVVWAGAYGAAGIAEADVFKCAGPDGKTTYQDAPCAQGSTGTTIRAPGAAAPAAGRSQPPDPGVGPAPGAGTAAPGPTPPAAVAGQPPRVALPVAADAGAYRALAAGNQADLANWQAKGGDAARYAKANPEAIYDAMGSERDVVVLEFVLKNGANANAQGRSYVKAPIFVNPLDRDKVALLIRYGADLKVSDYNGQTPLLLVLSAPASQFKMPPNPRPEQKVRVFTKLEVVRLLLDSGARFNGDLGGWAQAGALALARREDQDVIQLLIARGATLDDPDPGPRAYRPKRGPLTTAIQQDRDDLALALLGRDKSIAANDNQALLEAARRGFSQLALALLNAKADPNVADAKGATALGWALRRKDAPLTAALQSAGANPPAPPRPKLFAIGAFDAKWASQIDEVALFDSERFYINWRPPKPEDVAFMFYGDRPGQFEPFKCEQAVAFSLIAEQGRQGSMQVGICKSEAGRVRDAARSAKEGFAQLMTTLGSPVSTAEQRKAAGFEWDTATFAGGWDGYRFPLVAVGHGIAFVNTVVLSNPAQGRAVIVQAELTRLCEPSSGIRTQLKTPLCDDTVTALTDIALSVARTP